MFLLQVIDKNIHSDSVEFQTQVFKSLYKSRLWQLDKQSGYRGKLWASLVQNSITVHRWIVFLLQIRKQLFGLMLTDVSGVTEYKCLTVLYFRRHFFCRKSPPSLMTELIYSQFANKKILSP